MNLKELQEVATATSRDRGFKFNKEDTLMVATKIGLIGVEVSELLEEWRNATPRIHYAGLNNKPEGLGPEIADIILRTADLATVLGVDLETEVSEKLAFNKTRPHMHGGRRF